MGSEPKILEWIQRDLDGDLTPEERKVLMEHVSRTPQYQLLYHEYKSLSDDLARLPKVDPPTSLVDSMMASIEPLEQDEAPPESEATKAWNGSRKWLGAAAGVLILGIAGWLYANVETGPTTHQSSVGEQKNAMRSAADERTMIMSHPTEAMPVLWSPEGKYQARWEKQALVVRTAEGKIQVAYRPVQKFNQPLAMKWLNDERIELILPGNKRTVVDVEQKKAVQ